MMGVIPRLLPSTCVTHCHGPAPAWPYMREQGGICRFHLLVFCVYGAAVVHPNAPGYHP